MLRYTVYASVFTSKPENRIICPNILPTHSGDVTSLLSCPCSLGWCNSETVNKQTCHSTIKMPILSRKIERLEKLKRFSQVNLQNSKTEYATINVGYFHKYGFASVCNGEEKEMSQACLPNYLTIPISDTLFMYFVNQLIWLIFKSHKYLID